MGRHMKVEGGGTGVWHRLVACPADHWSVGVFNGACTGSIGRLAGKSALSVHPAGHIRAGSPV